MAVATVLPGASQTPLHSPAFRYRRFLNWFPLGLTYAFLYMGRYNLNVAKSALGPLMTQEDFGIIFAAGTLVYGVAFVINGPLTDSLGGRRAMLGAALGSAAANVLMGLYLRNVVLAGSVNNVSLRLWFSVLYAVNMYFQSFGAVAIVKVNASWFHVRERGGFSGIFGTMISSGIFMAYTVNAWILDFAQARAGTETATLQSVWVFFIPAALLFAMFGVESFLLKDRPSQAGQADFDTGDGSAQAEELPLKSVMWRIFTHPVVFTIALIEFCTGIVRQGVMQSYPFYAENVLALPSHHPLRHGSWGDLWTIVPFFATAALLGLWGAYARGPRRRWLFASAALVFLVPFFQGGWGGLLFVAGVVGGNVAGYVSDLFFQSRRAPAAGGLYGLLFLCSVAMVFVMGRALPVVQSSQVPGLLPHDRLLAVAGKTDLPDWSAVSRAFASVPSRCLAGAHWDSALAMCVTAASASTVGPPLAQGAPIPVLLEREGKQLTVLIEDPSPEMRAGDRRALRASPETTLSPYWLGAVVFIMSLCVIGTHGLLSGTATMDFGGRKGAATAVGMIDGFVYLGTGVQSVALGYLTSRSWSYWPWFLMPFSLIGFLLCLRIWRATPAQPSFQAPSQASVALPSRTAVVASTSLPPPR